MDKMDKRCKDGGTGPVTISDSVAKRLQEKKEKADPDGVSAELAQSDEKWLKMLKCMDDYHTDDYGLTMDNFEKVLSSTERQIALASKDFQPCHNKVSEVIRCYRRCSSRTLNCANEVQGFIECVDETKKEMEAAARNKTKMTDTFEQQKAEREYPRYSQVGDMCDT